MEHSDWYTAILRHETMAPIYAIANAELTGEKRPAIKSSSYHPAQMLEIEIRECCKYYMISVPRNQI